MELDTHSLFKPYLAVLLFHSVILALQLINPFNLLILIIYGFATWSLLDDGDKFKIIFIGILLDFAITILDHISQQGQIFFFFILQPVLIAFFSVIMYLKVREEYDFFKRTVLSLNGDDRLKARKALRTLDPVDIAAVAEYRDWKTVS